MATTILAVSHSHSQDSPEPQTQPDALNVRSEFERYSALALSNLTETQIDNLAVLAKIWGFLKYHHPRVVAGEFNWDRELLRSIDKVLDATNVAGRNKALARWIRLLGEPDRCNPCVVLPKNVHLTPRLHWLGEEALLGSELSAYLARVYEYRTYQPDQFYVGNFGGPTHGTFANESKYADLPEVDGGFRLLALFRYWNIIEYWYPYYDLIGETWDDVLRESIPRFVAANSLDAYALALRATIARIHDSHAGLWSAQRLPPSGDCILPIAARFIQDQATVTAFTNSAAALSSGLKIGDTIRAIDGVLLTSLIADWAPYYPSSNEASFLRLVGTWMTRGPCEETTLTVGREDDEIQIDSMRIPATQISFDGVTRHDLDGESFQFLVEDIAYLKLSNIKAADISGYIEKATDSKGLIIDLRSYPSEFVVFELGQRLVQKTTAFALWTLRDLSNPGTFYWTPNNAVLQPGTPNFGGQVVVLVDEVTQSQAEYTAMALQAAPKNIVVGSTTAGTDGDIVYIPLPGGIQTAISGAGVFYPDKSPTQRIGIVPDFVVSPTIAGIRERRDEVIEFAVTEILAGEDADELR